MSRASISRRKFLKGQLTLASGVALMGSRLWTPGWSIAATTPDVVVAKGEPALATRVAVKLLGGMDAFVKPGNKVVIKPNMSFANPPESATNTHPEVVRELVALCKEAGASKVLVLDHPLHEAELCLEESGIREACKIFNEDIVRNLTRSSFYRNVKIPKGVDMKETDIMKDVLEAEVFIAAPVAKSHSVAGVSLSMKGMMGVIWNRVIMHSTHDLHSAIVDLCTVAKPHLTVVDATRVLASHGPAGPGKVVKKDLVIASPDMVAADAQTVLVSEWHGQRMEPRQVKHIRLAHERGLGRMDVEKLVVKEVEA